MPIAHDERVLNTSRRIFQEFVVRMHFGCLSRIIEQRFPPRTLFPPTGGGEYAINRGVLGGLSFYGRILRASVTNTWTKSICDRNLSVGAFGGCYRTATSWWWCDSYTDCLPLRFFVNGGHSSTEIADWILAACQSPATSLDPHLRTDLSGLKRMNTQLRIPTVALIRLGCASISTFLGTDIHNCHALVSDPWGSDCKETMGIIISSIMFLFALLLDLLKIPGTQPSQKK